MASYSYDSFASDPPGPNFRLIVKISGSSFEIRAQQAKKLIDSEGLETALKKIQGICDSFYDSLDTTSKQRLSGKKFTLAPIPYPEVKDLLNQMARRMAGSDPKPTNYAFSTSDDKYPPCPFPGLDDEELDKLTGQDRLAFIQWRDECRQINLADKNMKLALENVKLSESLDYSRASAQKDDEDHEVYQKLKQEWTRPAPKKVKEPEEAEGDEELYQQMKEAEESLAKFGPTVFALVSSGKPWTREEVAKIMKKQKLSGQCPQSLTVDEMMNMLTQRRENQDVGSSEESTLIDSDSYNVDDFILDGEEYLLGGFDPYEVGPDDGCEAAGDEQPDSDSELEQEEDEEDYAYETEHDFWAHDNVEPEVSRPRLGRPKFTWKSYDPTEERTNLDHTHSLQAFFEDLRNKPAPALEELQRTKEMEDPFTRF